jgi:hypothetical protein
MCRGALSAEFHKNPSAPFSFSCERGLGGRWFGLDDVSFSKAKLFSEKRKITSHSGRRRCFHLKFQDAGWEKSSKSARYSHWTFCLYA